MCFEGSEKMFYAAFAAQSMYTDDDFLFHIQGIVVLDSAQMEIPYIALVSTKHVRMYPRLSCTCDENSEETKIKHLSSAQSRFLRAEGAMELECDS